MFRLGKTQMTGLQRPAGLLGRTTQLPGGQIHVRPIVRMAVQTQPRMPPGFPSMIPTIKIDTTTLPENFDKNLRQVKEISYVSRRRFDDTSFDPDAVDEDGLPLVYNEERISQFWKGRPGELATRWARFAGISAPWLTSLANAVIQGKVIERQGPLARDAVTNLEKLGPTFIKLGQIMSIRPDVLPPAVMAELAKLQDNITPFDSTVAFAMVEKELGKPISEIFSEFSSEPVAAASLAQVYRARLRSTGEEVAVKVQRPGALSIISKDLYVLRRGVGVYEGFVKRFTAQTTDYQQLLSTFAEGLYTELDFRNEALNGMRMQTLLDESEFSSADVVIPKPVLEYTTRRVLTMEWITGVKLTTLSKPEIRDLIKVGQEAFLTQLLQIGFIHGDPHPGNLLKVTEGPNAGKLALLDFGLVAEIPPPDRAAMISSVIHLANRDWDSLIDDFIALNFLPANCDRGKIIPVMERVLGPYLKGGGAKSFNFSALSQDLLAVTLEIPFSVPPYMSLIARSVVTLEGLALMGDENYQMVAQAYPFVVRKVLRNEDAGASSLLRSIIYDSSGNVKPTRMNALLNAALGYVSDKKEGFIDFDAVPADGASVKEIISFLLAPDARDLRPLIINELSTFSDLLLRDRTRRSVAALPSFAPRLPFFGALPLPPAPPLYLPGIGFKAVAEVVDLLAPPLTASEQVYLQSLTELGASLLGVKASDIEDGAGLFQLVSNPTAQATEMFDALQTIGGSSTNSQVVSGIVSDVAERLLSRQSERAGVPAETLFPFLPILRQSIAQLGTSGSFGALQGHSSADSSAGISSARSARSRGLSSSAGDDAGMSDDLELSKSLTEGHSLPSPVMSSHAMTDLESLLESVEAVEAVTVAESHQPLLDGPEIVIEGVMGDEVSPPRASVLV